MKGQWKRGWLAAAVLFATATVGLAQTNMAAPGSTGYPNAANYPAAPQRAPGTMDNSSSRMASPGTVNYVEGRVMLDGQPLPQRSYTPVVVQPNQVIDTSDGYVEILLTPGAFLRLGHNSEVRLVNAGLTAVNLQLNRGTAMIEAAELVKGSDLEVAINGAKALVEQKGLYSFDANQHSVKVLDGKALVMESAGETTLKKGDAVFLASDRPTKRRDFDVKAAQAEPLYVWSKVRSEDQSRANASMAQTIAVNGGWYGPGWYWNPYWADYAFLPGAGFLYSPFGWGFYSPGFAYLGGFGYGNGFYGRGFYGHGVYGHVGGVGAGVRAFGGGGFHGGGFHGSGRR
jgi:hypothetical protein